MGCSRSWRMVAAVIAFIVFVMVALDGAGRRGPAAVAYLKRDTWTKPAYSWAKDKSGQVVTPAYHGRRDKSGRWRGTPWSAGTGPPRDGAAPDAAPTDEPATRSGLRGAPVAQVLVSRRRRGGEGSAALAAPPRWRSGCRPRRP